MAGGEWDALLKRTRARGEALGITTESDVERLSDVPAPSKKAQLKNVRFVQRRLT